MRVHEIRVPRRTARGPREAAEETRHEGPAPRLAPQVSEHAGAVGDPEVPEARRRDDFHVDARRPHPLDRVRDEPARGVIGVARKRRRQDDDVQSGTSRRPKTTGSASASIVSA